MDSIGTIEGTLEGVTSEHGRSRCIIVDPVTGRYIVCFIGSQVPWNDVLKAIGKRVAVTGCVESLLATRVDVFPPDETLPSAADVLGILKPSV